MKLRKVIIENFRSIKRCSFDIDTLLALVGENNSGKSSVLRALNAFFNFESEKPFFVNERHRYSPATTVTRIEVRFCDLPTDFVIAGQSVNGELAVRMKYSYTTKRRTFEYKVGAGYRQLSIDEFEDICQHIHYVFIPLNRDHTQMQWSNQGLLHTVVTEYLQRHTKARDNLSPVVRDAARSLERIGLKKIEREVERYYTLNHEFNFRIGYPQELDYTLLLNNISLQIEDYGKHFDIADTGSGIQSLTTISLYRYLAHLKHDNFVLGIEEPETNLHPQAQRELIRTLKSTRDAKEIQIIFTTHSTVILDEMDHTEVVLFRRVEDQTRNFITIARQLPLNFWDKYNLEEFNYYQFYRYRNSEFFFARFVVVVESKNDAQVVRELLAQKSIDPDLYGVSFLSLDGIKNLKYPYYLLKELSIPYFIIVDKDFFLPYSNDKLSQSRNSRGFPKYKNQFKSSNHSLIEELIPVASERDQLLRLLRQNHSKALDLLVKRNVICMNYTLEIDLVASHTAAGHFYSVLNVPNSNRSQTELLMRRGDQIKKIDVLLQVIRRTPHKNLPNSFKRIKNVLGDLIPKLKSVSKGLPD
jgi:putative ATP-dependent endonuclease of OLD family